MNIDTDRVAENLAKDFVDRPFDYVAEADVQARLVEQLRDQLEDGKLHAEFSDGVDTPLEMQKNHSYKDPQWDFHRQKLADQQPSRVLTEVVDTSVTLSECELVDDSTGTNSIDVVLMDDHWDNPVRWNDGSKRYSADDFTAAFELKYIKNKYFFPHDSSEIDGDDVTALDDEAIQRYLDWDENSIGEDLCELSQLQNMNVTDDDFETYLIIFSNFDYLYTTTRNGVSSDVNTNIEKEQDRRPGYVDVGKAAEKGLSQNAGETKILYANADHHLWINR